MSPGDSASKTSRPAALRLLEHGTALLLGLVLLALGWIVLAAYQSDIASWLATEVQIIIVLVLLGAALALVSIVALLHTRS